MRSAFNKEIVRSIKGSAGRFIAIAVISFLGAGFYAGLRMAAPDMRLAADEFYDATALYDISVACTLGLDDDSLDTLQSIEGVQEVMASCKVDALVQVGDGVAAAAVESIPPASAASDTSDGVHAHSDDDRYLNRPILLEGRWPQEAAECVVGIAGAEALGLQPGDSLVLQEAAGELSDSFAVTEFTIVGLVNSPAYIADTSLGVTELGSGAIDLYAFAPMDAFAEDLPYTAAYLTVQGARDQWWDSVDYDQAVAPVLARVEEAAPGIGLQREEAIRADAQAELDDARREFEDERADAQAELDDAHGELADAQAELDDARAQLTDARSQLDSARAQLDSSQKTLAESKETLDANEAEYQEGAAALEAQRKELQPAIDGLPALKAQRAALASQPQADPAALAALDAQIKQIEEGSEQLAAAQKQLQGARAQLDAGWKQYNEGMGRWRQGEEDYKSGLADYESGKAEYEEGLASYREGLAEYEDGKAEAEREFADAEADLAEAQQEIDDLESAEVFVMDRSKNAGAASLAHDAESITQIATFLPFMFFLVAALVVLTSMTRMVDEERLDIGTHKALGYGRARITSKYLIYGVAACGAGSILGVLTLGQLLPWFIMTSYAVSYSVPVFSTPIDDWIAVKAVGLSLLVTVVATWGAAAASLREKPAALMLPKVPRAGKRILLERIGPVWRRLSFSHKVTMRNLLRYKRRFFMAVVGIAGCTALLMIGFGLRDAISDIVTNQYEQIITYDAQLGLDEDASDDQRQAVDDALAADDVASSLEVHGEALIASGPDGDMRFDAIVPLQPERFPDFVSLRDRASGEAIPLESDSLVITEKAARELGLQPGDTITLYGQNAVGDKEGAGHDFTVGAITENYLQHYLYIDPGLYARVMGEEPQENRLFVNLTGGADQQAFIDRMLALDAVSTASLVSEQLANYEDMLGVMDKLIIVIVLLSAALAFVVLYNLTNINISERVREIATLKVLGFTPREVDAYIFREIIIMVVIGALIGCLVGVPLTFYIAEAAETTVMMFGRTIQPLSFVAAFAITVAFAFIVAVAMRRKLARVNMVESLKSVE